MQAATAAPDRINQNAMLHAIAQRVKLPRLFTAMLPGSMPLIGFRHDGLTRAARAAVDRPR
uniref:Uncharacterized protein n=1 Tax=Erwinia amylovora ATCC BAA-2158 TaxID=889211 RepID=E5B815_ERWAM|nr:hypothetical protein predicted by Glimmer/Critica [Erwinia amylovora ATCC BAA-2158]